MSSESTPYRPFAKKDRDAVIKAAVDAIKQDRFDLISDEEIFRLARIQYIRERMTATGNAGKQGDTLERLYGELEKKWKVAQKTKNKKKLEAGKATPEQPGQRPDIMDEKTFNAVFGGLSSVVEEPIKLPETENVPLIPFEELEEITKEEKASIEKFKKGQKVAVKISLPINGQDKEFVLMGEVVKPSPKEGEASTIIKYLGGLTEDEEKSAVENKFIRNGYIKVDNKLIYTGEMGSSDAAFIERETGVHPSDKIEVEGYEGYFRTIGVGKNSSPEKPTVIIISEMALKNGPRLEDEMEVPISQVKVIKRHTPTN
ncbi:MAG: hypothetical protein AAB561_00315 [Patescibacteria group bacterium]